jgi:hypothetical protein
MVFMKLTYSDLRGLIERYPLLRAIHDQRLVFVSWFLDYWSGGPGGPGFTIHPKKEIVMGAAEQAQPRPGRGSGVTIGRIVHFREMAHGATRAAIVSEVWIDEESMAASRVNLHIFNGLTGHVEFKQEVPYAEPPEPGWSWPPRE